MPVKKQEARLESYGELEHAVPQSAYWGAATAQMLGTAMDLPRIPAHLLKALLHLYKARAVTGFESGLIDAKVGRAAAQAADEILLGQWQDQIFLSILQPAAIFGLEENIKEVLANRTGEMLGFAKGSYLALSPESFLSSGADSSSDFVLALAISLSHAGRDLFNALRELERALRRKALEFEREAKKFQDSGEQDFALMCSRKFSSYGTTLAEHCQEGIEALTKLLELRICKDSFGKEKECEIESSSSTYAAIVEKLRTYTGLELRIASDRALGIFDTSTYLDMSSRLKLLSLTIQQIGSDIKSQAEPQYRAQNSEIFILPPFFARASSKAYPDRGENRIPDFVTSVCFQITGLDSANLAACQGANLDRNALLALLAANLLQATELLVRTLQTFSNRYVSQISLRSKNENVIVSCRNSLHV